MRISRWIVDFFTRPISFAWLARWFARKPRLLAATAPDERGFAATRLHSHDDFDVDPWLGRQTATGADVSEQPLHSLPMGLQEELLSPRRPTEARTRAGDDGPEVLD